jgi:hypothetical protein
MTRFTKMSVSPAKPLGDIATKLAFEFDIIGSMLFA